QLALRSKPLDLVVLDQQNRLHARFPGDEELLPERVVVALARLGTEDRDLPTGRGTLDEVLRRQSLYVLELSRVVDTQRTRLALVRDVGHEVGVLVAVVIRVEGPLPGLGGRS